MKPLFIPRFLLLYLCLQGLYTVYLSSYKDASDVVTIITAKCVSALFKEGSTQLPPQQDYVLLCLNQKGILRISEACNAISIFCCLLAFLFAIPGKAKDYLWLIPASMSLLFAANLARLSALIQIKRFAPTYFALFHEYLFPASLYLLAFAIMVFWMNRTKSQTP
ncbi:MAG: exosortase/archaeosortase family protein [Bacteroidia bacterium]|nr:exosortase/archaeosortase family protein [Bacteroidia bacterium]